MCICVMCMYVCIYISFLFSFRNIVSTVNLNCKLDLKKIALHARNAEYNPKVMFFFYLFLYLFICICKFQARFIVQDS